MHDTELNNFLCIFHVHLHKEFLEVDPQYLVLLCYEGSY